MRQGWAIPAGGGSEGMRDYHVYRMNWRERFLCIGITFVLSGMVSWLFYRSFWGMLSLPVFCVPVRKAVRESLMRKRRQEMLFHFREMLQMASAAVKAGYAMENAFVQAQEEFVKLYGAHTVMAEEFGNINRQAAWNIPLEKLLEDLAERSGIEEIISFTQVFAFAKRSGGDFMKIFNRTVDKIRQKAEVKREIETVMASKRMEMNLMNLMPFGILFYVGATSPEFLEPLYGNWLGAVIMTACLAAYGAAYLIGRRIVEISV